MKLIKIYKPSTNIAVKFHKHDSDNCRDGCIEDWLVNGWCSVVRRGRAQMLSCKHVNGPLLPTPQLLQDTEYKFIHV